MWVMSITTMYENIEIYVLLTGAFRTITVCLRASSFEEGLYENIPRIIA